MLTVGSLFAGIGGFDLGLERAGMRTVWFCEQDEFCQRVLARHWPGVPCYPDVRALVADTGGARRRQDVRGAHGDEGTDAGRGEADADVAGGGGEGDGAGPVVPVPVPPVDGELGVSDYVGIGVPAPDVLVGGFPCQDISFAGRGAGLAGERSGLWREFARLIGELRPRYVIVENVPALTARGLDVVLGDLAACGFDAEWDHLPASAFGAPHRRDRIWLVAYPKRQGLQGRAVPSSERETITRARDDRPLADPEGASVGAGLCEGGSRWLGRRRSGNGGGPLHAWTVEPDVGRVAHGIPARPHGPRWATPKATDAERGGRGDLIQQVRGNASPSGHFKSSDQQEGAAGASDDGSLRAMRSDGGTDEASPRLFGAGAGSDPLLRVPREGGSGTGPTSNEEAEALRDLRRDVHELQPLTGEDLLAAMSVRGWSPELIEALGGWWAIEPPVGRVAVGVPQRVDRLRALGNALVPQIAEWIGRQVLEYERRASLRGPTHQ